MIHNIKISKNNSTNIDIPLLSFIIKNKILSMVLSCVISYIEYNDKKPKTIDEVLYKKKEYKSPACKCKINDTIIKINKIYSG